jgi:hypothetical protein
LLDTGILRSKFRQLLSVLRDAVCQALAGVDLVVAAPLPEPAQNQPAGSHDEQTELPIAGPRPELAYHQTRLGG